MPTPPAPRSVAVTPALDPPDTVALLRVIDPQGREEVHVLDRPALHIGSARETCALVLRDPAIAAIHCTLRWRHTGWVVHDRGAPAGTYINDLRCREPTALGDGDRLTIAHHRIEFLLFPSLALPHVLARLRHRPTDWSAPRRIDTPAPPSPRPRTPVLAGLAALITTIVVLFAASTARSTVSADAAADLSPGPSERSAPPTLDLSPGPSERPAPPALDLSPGPSEQSAPPALDLSPGPSATSPPAPLEFVTEPPRYELPPDAIGLGTPTNGQLLNAIRLPPSPEYTIRCAAHAYATSATVGELMHGLALLRNRGYRGELVVGDLSRPDGGRYGPHKSHQSGRDVDIWLPIRGGRYHRGCARCGTDLCRPEPGAVDWQATWRMIEALRERGAVQDIFLDWTLHPALREAAVQLGVPDEQIDRTIQHPVRGRATLLKHSDGHVHHLHVRYREPA